MSKTRFDRRRPTGDQWKQDYFPLGGGLDQRSSALAIKPGRMVQGINVEEVFGQQGYRTIRGYERFDGRPSPSACNFAAQPFDTGTAAIAAGDVVTNPSGATGLVVSVTLSSGSWAGGDAAGVLILTTVSGAWADNDVIQVSAVTRALASDETEPGSKGYGDGVEDWETALRAAREALRALIEKPPGEGAILGVAVYNDAVYCVRNAVGGQTATLFKSTAAGWASVKTNLHPGGAYKFDVANFSGASTETSLYGVNGRGRLFKIDRNGVYTVAAPIYGSEATSLSSNSIGTGAKTFSITETTRSWIAGDELTAWDSNNPGNFIAGTVLSYNSGTNTLVLTGVTTGGSGTIGAWEIGETDYSDKPYALAEHKDHMFLGYPFGQLQSSNLGDPLGFTTTAALFGIGEDLTDITSLRGEILGIFCRTKIKLLRGSSSLDWDLGTHTNDVGAVTGTAQDNAGNAIFLEDRGLTCFQATLNFGDFDSAILSSDAKKTLDALRPLTVGSRMAKNNYQYRLYFSDGGNLRCTIQNGNPVITPRDVAFSYSKYECVMTCWASGVMENAVRMFAGTEDGWVIEEDAGTSFDGEEIPYVVRLPFNHCKSPNIEKRWHQLLLELDSPDPITIRFRQIFNYDDGEYQHGGTMTADVLGVGGQYDVDGWDTFQFDLPNVTQARAAIDGVGENMALLLAFESDFARPVTMQGLMTNFSILEVRKG